MPAAQKPDPKPDPKPGQKSDAPEIASVWTRPRRQREQLSREQIVAEAVRLLDADGLEALSMRKLGTRLDAGATSLYRHVANKDELIELVVDEVYGELDVPAADDGKRWRAASVHSAYSLRAMILRHPWVASVLGQVGLIHLGPNVTRMSERMTAVYATAGFPADETEQAMSTVISYIIGMATSEAAYLSLIARSGKTEREFAESLRGEGEGDPRMRDPEKARDETFDYGLQRVLDGLTVRLSAS
ncbi:TetR/AcrR family transcriptional regulator [Streptomyces kanamyceticus]|uniref:TetR/AcrR family transcriptional regulator n=1 Tax=Streptomyces kanamyceticus TaxID=1967 RepID=A0A5J6GDN8_STRKN|nr:TetR/AcrR family transcriptional regulator [Streptomyces kanamyceticus]QEU93037.1 TetR/AcrR family transcriptional regulator [Streptomyces kanamyceticus]